MPDPTISPLADPDLERSFLFGVTIYPHVIDLVPVRDAHFADPRHKEIFRLLAGMRSDGIEIGNETVWQQASARDVVRQCGGLSYICTLDSTSGGVIAGPVYPQNAQRVLDRLEDLRKKRELEAMSARMRARLTEPGVEAGELIAEAQDALGELGKGNLSETVLIGPEMVEAVDEYENTKPGETLGVSMGMRELDNFTNGCLPGQLIIIAGRPGMGKTSFAVGMAADQALVDREPVVFFSAEMTKREIVARMMQWATQIPSKRFRHGYHGREERETLRRWVEANREIPLRINDKSSPRCSEIIAEVRRWHGKGLCRLVYIDHLGFVIPDKPTDNRNADIESMTRAFKALAKDLKITVVLLSQLNRGVERRGSDRRPILSDLRDSGAIEQDADGVIFVYRESLYRPEDPEHQGMAELIVAKCRDGETGIVRCAFNPETTTFRSLDRRHG